MITIHKYPLDFFEESGASAVVNVPEDAELLDIQFQRGVMCAWYLLDDSAPVVGREFMVSSTGGPFDAAREHVRHFRTIQSGGYVWHIFEVLR